MTMIEKVARAINLEGFKLYGELEIIEWEDLEDDIKIKLLSLAKAAIEAIREPSEGMVKFETVSGDIFDWNCPCNYCGGHKFAVEAYIDAALKEEWE